MNDYNKDKEIIQVTKNFFDIKRSADQLNNNVKQQTLKIKNSIVHTFNRR